MGAGGVEKETVGFKPENPSRMKADGKIKRAGPLIGQGKDRPGHKKGEEGGDQWRRMTEHLPQERQAGMPLHGPSRFSFLDEMDGGIDGAAADQGGRPRHGLAQQAEQRAAKNQLFQDGHHDGCDSGVEQKAKNLGGRMRQDESAGPVRGWPSACGFRSFEKSGR